MMEVGGIREGGGEGETGHLQSLVGLFKEPYLYPEREGECQRVLSRRCQDHIPQLQWTVG